MAKHCKKTLKNCLRGARGKRARGKCRGKFSKCRSRKRR